MGRKMGERFKKEGTYVYLWLIHADVWQKPTKYCVSQVVLMVKNPPANAGDLRDLGSIPGSGRFPGGGHGNLFQYSSLKNPMDRGA